VTEDKAGIGYSGVGYKTSGVRALKVARKDGDTAWGVDDPAHVYNGDYPIARFLYVYVNRAPGKPLDPLVGQFLTYVLAHEGQETVVKDGFLPLPEKIDAEESAKLR